MTIYTLVLIKHTKKTPIPQVHVFNNFKDARSFAFDWMFDLTNKHPMDKEQMDFHMLNLYCLSEDLCTIEIKSHIIKQ